MVRRMLQAAKVLAGAGTLVLAFCILMPEALAFPYHRQVGQHRIYAERPIPNAIEQVVARADVLVATSPLYEGSDGERIFLTDGGWRWRLLSLRSAGAFALTRAVSETIVVNRSDVTRDLVWNGAAVAGRRSLSGVLAHERAHGMIRAHYGILADARLPGWLREGYCDHVAGGGTLNDAEAARLVAQGHDVPALQYYRGRKRVEAILRDNGGSVDALFRGGW